MTPHRSQFWHKAKVWKNTGYRKRIWKLLMKHNLRFQHFFRVCIILVIRYPREGGVSLANSPQTNRHTLWNNFSIYDIYDFMVVLHSLIPLSILMTASIALRLPLKESGATMNRMF